MSLTQKGNCFIPRRWGLPVVNRTRVIPSLTRNLSTFTRVRSGFTLIELLVVVLIIGILAAVAVPQYQKAIDKSRLMTLIPLVKAVADAKSVHYMNTGEWARTFDVLSVDLPQEFTIADDSYYGQGAHCDPKRMSVFLDASDHEVAGRYRLNRSTSDQLVWYYIVGNTKTCNGYGARGAALCASLPGATFKRQTDTFTSYRIN